MIKLGIKGIIFLMGIQSLFGKLQSEGIVTGSIKINYVVLQHKIIEVISSDEVNGMINKFENSEDEYYQPSPTIPKNERVRVFHHTVQRGETLSDLGDTYGVSWKVIKKANQIHDERFLQIGQNIIIPVLQTGMV